MYENFIHSIEENFKIPIYHLEEKTALDSNVIDDLELVQSKENLRSLYQELFTTDAPFTDDIAEVIIKQFSKHYTNDVQFLKQTQELLTSPMSHTSEDARCSNEHGIYFVDNKDLAKSEGSSSRELVKTWQSIRYADSGAFKNEYGYVNWKMWDTLNSSGHFMQLLSVYNLFIPFTFLVYPFFILLASLVIMISRGYSTSQYPTIVHELLSNNSIYIFLTRFSSLKDKEKAYNVVSCLIYFFNIYQNIMVFRRFVKNMYKIFDNIAVISAYLANTVQNMDEFLKYSADKDSYKEFNEILADKKNAILELSASLNAIKLYSFSKVADFGYIMKTYYALHTNDTYDNLVCYALGFNKYLSLMSVIKRKVANKELGVCRYITNAEKVIIKDTYHPTTVAKTPTKNTVKLGKNAIISGPNASGKTTCLKTVLINIIFSQQFGCGYYSSFNLYPFKYVYSYVNIPDTSGRDSLFQAEARRCKQIMDSINASPTDRHFCIFDELYSGTNPEDAVDIGFAFLNNLASRESVRFMITTHFIKMCKRFRKNPNVVNYNMLTEEITSDNDAVHPLGGLKYKYQLVNGITKITKGGLRVIQQMGFSL